MDTIQDGTIISLSVKPISVDPDWPMLGDELPPGDYVKLSVSCPAIGWAGETSSDSASGTKTTASLMKAMGGSINIHESPDIGTTMSLYFKAASQDADTPDEKSAAASPRITEMPPPLFVKPSTILVVEDDDAVRKLTAKALRMAGHTVIEAEGGPEAIEKFNESQNEIDLLITDVIMPGMNGREVCDQIGAIRPELPVLFCSGYSSDLLENEYMVNIHGLVIQKPYRSAELLATTARLLS